MFGFFVFLILDQIKLWKFYAIFNGIEQYSGNQLY